MSIDMLILLDYRLGFYSSTRSRGASFDVSRLRVRFEQMGYTVFVKQFSELNLRNTNYKGTLVLYQSSEDQGLSYKDYIEDVLLGLTLQEALLIPDLPYFRAHHNKVFMEILRDVHGNTECQRLASQTFGTYEEYQRLFVPENFPVVLKPSAGSKSRDVAIAHNKKEADRYARSLSATPSFFNFMLSCRNLFDRRGFSPISNNRSKFTIQPFIPNLLGDYKILVYGDKYFVVFRENRPNDFRASGSGRLSFPKDVPREVLTFAKQIFENFDVPFVSLDIGYDGKTCYLFEFQFVLFGQYTVEHSAWYFFWNETEWSRADKRSVVEDEFALAIHMHVQKKHKEISDGT